MFKTSELYLANLNATEDLVINQGGTSSGKTYSIVQALFSIAIREKCDILIVGQSIPNLKVGAIKDAATIVESSEELKQLITHHNKTDQKYTFTSGSTMQFKSFNDWQDAKSGKREYSFFNEINGIPKPIFDEIYLRTSKRTWVDYNPNERFWIHDYIGKEGVKFLRTWHEHNPFLDQKVRDKIEALKDIDEELWKVYARGMTGKIEGLVFRNWVRGEKIPDDAKYISNWLDYGFTNDPTASGEMWQLGDTLYLKSNFYEPGLVTTDIADRMDKESRYVADNSESRLNEELNRMGFKVYDSEKGKGSILAGIDILKRYKLVLIGSTLEKEFNSYKWKVDRRTGEPINEPIDAFNHHIDGIRYVARRYLKTNKRGVYNIEL